MSSPIVHLNSKTLPEIADVGGKGYSLVRLSSLDLNVPNGIILTVSFFEAWIKTIKETSLYKEFIEVINKDSTSNECSSILDQIKEWCLAHLTLTEQNKKDIQYHLHTIFPEDYDKILYAVRSSSPEEDLAGASFAGNYETYLGIQFDALETYVLKSFISCIDYRVFKYKMEKGFDGSDIKIAIVIMKQINSEVSGVGFSINPINNDYDEAVINSNFGLGESVVAGIITPDEFIVNKFTKKVISKKLGSKDKVVKLNEGQNETSVVEQNQQMKEAYSLTDELVLQLVEDIIRIEKSYDIPIDIEFGIENNQLYILQARPITTFNPIPKDLLTAPGEERQLYFDATLGVQGFEKPMSTLGASVFKGLAYSIGEKVLGSNQFADIRKSALDAVDGKILVNFSNLFTKISPTTMTNLVGNMNQQLPEILKAHGESYINSTKCHEIDVSLWGMAWRLPVFRIIFGKFLAPVSLKLFDRRGEHFMASNMDYIEKNLKSEVSVQNIMKKLGDEMAVFFRDCYIPMILIFMGYGYLPLNKIFTENFDQKDPELKQDFNNLTKSLPFITILMGLDLYHLTDGLDKTYYQQKTQEEFYQDYVDKKLPAEFYTKFEEFLRKYGFRGEGELDIQSQRYFEDPRTLLNQIYSSLITSDSEHNPQKDYDDTNAQRPEVFKKLYDKLKEKDAKQAKAFEQAYHFTVNYFHIREAPKYYLIFVIGKIKEVLLARTSILTEKGLIDDKTDIYKMTITSLSKILDHPEAYTKEDVAQIIKEDNAGYEMFDSWKQSALVFDSRGRIFKPEKKQSSKKNELIGDTVSFGKVRGKAKVLNSVNEKPFNPGEILITRATDPGWTPLIINCGGIILEVGGMLQHGALVSREFNKPCVVGIDNITKMIHDGEEIEVDAIEGIVRLLDREE